MYYPPPNQNPYYPPQQQQPYFNPGQYGQMAVNTFNNTMDSMRPMVNNAMANMGQVANNVSKSITDILPKAPTLDSLSSNSASSSASSSPMISASLPNPPVESRLTKFVSFFSFNSIVTKIAFLLFIIIMFLLLIKLTMSIMIYSYQEKNNPILVEGVIAGTTAITITRDPKKSNSVTLPRSNNQYYGAEFTWSVWLNVNSVTVDKYSHVFSIGNSQANSKGIMSVNNAPGIYLMQHKSQANQQGHSLGMRIIMDTEPFHNYNLDNFSKDGSTITDRVNTENIVTHNKSIDITELPFNNWFNVMVRLGNSVLDIYINGTIAGRINFETVPKQNFYDIQICQNSGFSGYLSNLKYYARSLNVFDINAVVLAGPNLNSPVIKGASNSPALPGGKLNSYDYLSNLWYYKTDD